jgi:hypothetical protein
MRNIIEVTTILGWASKPSHKNSSSALFSLFMNMIANTT